MRNAPLIFTLLVLGAAYILTIIINAPRLARMETQARFTDLTQRHDAYIAGQRKLILNGVSFSDGSESKPLAPTPPQETTLSEDEKATVLRALKDGFDGLNKHHLEACQSYEVYDRTIKINRNTRLKDDYTTEPVSVQTLLRAAAKYMGDAVTLPELRAVAEAEIAALQTDYQALETRLIQDRLAPDIETYAALPVHIRRDAARIKNDYEDLLRELSGLFEPYLYDYGAPQAEVKVVTRTHTWNAVASYQRSEMVLYFNTPTYDAKDYAFLAVHEIMPGHHLDHWAGRKPKICAPYKSARTRLWQEGWATYAESLADEAGFFDAPDRRLGWLDYRMIRAVRILMDIEISENGDDYEALKALWTSRMPPRSRALFDREYKRLKRAKHHHLSYILGAQAIMDARVALEQKRGKDFDIKAFHDAFLRGQYADGAVFEVQIEAALLSLKDKTRQDIQ